MSDVRLYHTPDGGDISVERGAVELSPGLETAAYLSLFGGREWWGNLGETEPARKYTAETGALLDSLPATSANLRKIEDAAARDLAWFPGAVTVAASIPAPDTVKLSIDIEGDERVEFVENWKANV